MTNFEDKMEKKAEDFITKPGRTILKWVLWIMLIGAIITTAGYFITAALSPVKGTMKVIEKTYDGDKIFSDYEWFYNQNESYSAIKSQIEAAKQAVKTFKKDAGSRKDWTFEDKNEYSRLNSVVTGLEFQLKDVVKNYNARSKMWTRNQFKSSDLPYTLPLN